MVEALGESRARCARDLVFLLSSPLNSGKRNVVQDHPDLCTSLLNLRPPGCCIFRASWEELQRRAASNGGALGAAEAEGALRQLLPAATGGAVSYAHTALDVEQRDEAWTLDALAEAIRQGPLSMPAARLPAAMKPCNLAAC